MRVHAASLRPLPVVLPPLPDELLSSWLGRHASFYGVTGKRLLRHRSLEVASLRGLDLGLTRPDQRRLAHLLRCCPRAVSRMTQARGRGRAVDLVATVRPMQVCGRCASRHQVEPATRGARLRSWMEGWRIDCPVRGAALEDARPLDRLTKADPVPLLVGVAEQARAGEAMMTRAVRAGWPGKPVVALMRSVLLPRASRRREALPAREVPRLLDTVVPGFDRYLHRSYPGCRRPGAMLLPVGVRMPVLAGVAQVAGQPDLWAERLLGAVAETARPGLMACLKSLLAVRSRPQPPTGRLWSG